MRFARTTVSSTLIEAEPCGRSLLLLLGLPGRVFGGVAGEGDEHVVERRAVERDVVDPTPAASSLRTVSGITPWRGCTGAWTTPSSAVARSRHISARAAIGGCVGGVLELDVEPLAADLGLELVRGALGDHAAVVDHHDPVGEPVGLVEVLGGEGTVAPAAARGLDRLHMPMRLRGSSPVVGSSRNKTGGRATSAAARSSRRRMPPE